jgi:hypothetical protein
MNEERALRETSMFDNLLSRMEQLYGTLDKQTIVIREKVTKLAVEVNEMEEARPESTLIKAPETIIEKLNDFAYKLEGTSGHLSITLRMLDKII